MKTRPRCASLILVIALLVGGVVATGCLPQGTILSGHLTPTAPEASPVAGVPVVAYSSTDEMPVASTVTDSSGFYSFATSKLPEGTYRLRFGENHWYPDAGSWQAAGDLPSSAADPATADATFAIPSGGLSGKVDDGVDALPGIAVIVVRKQTGDIAAQTTTDAAGNFVLERLYPQDYSFVFADPNERMRAVLWGSTTSDRTSGTGFGVVADSTSDYGVFGMVGRDCDPDLVHAGVDLTGAVLTNCDLSYDDLTGVNFNDADLTNADLTGAQLFGVHLADAVLDHASLYYSRSGGIVGVPTSLPSSWMLVDGYLIGPGVSLEAAQLDAANLSNSLLTFSRLVDAHLAGADISGANLSSANLTGADLTGAYLGGASLVRTDLTSTMLGNADFSGADLRYAKISGVDIAGAVFTDANLAWVKSNDVTGVPAALPKDWSLVDGYLIGPGASLASAQLAAANLTGTSLLFADLTGAHLENADLTQADCRGLGLSDAQLAGADLTGADLASAKLMRADLSGATLTGVNLDAADLTNATLAGVVSGGITGTPDALPVGWSLVNGELVGP